MRIYVEALLLATDDQLIQIAAEAHRRGLDGLYYLITGGRIPKMSESALIAWRDGAGIDEVAAAHGSSREEAVRRLFDE